MSSTTDPMSDNLPDVATISAALEALEGAISFTTETRGLPGDPSDPDLLILAKARTALESLSARVTQDQREVAHIACDCVPDLGPMHCHLCSTKQGREVAWTDCEGRVTQAETTAAQHANSTQLWAQRTSPSTVVVRRGLKTVLALIDDGEVGRLGRELLALDSAAPLSPGTGNEASDRRAPVQSGAGKPRGSVAWWEHVEAWNGYHQKHNRQTAERIAERGGFGYNELLTWLRREPTTWTEGQIPIPPAAPVPGNEQKGDNR